MRMPIYVPPLSLPTKPTTTARKSNIGRLFINATASIATGFVVGNSNEEHEVGMPWYFDKQQLRDTPSIRDGISFDTERRYRKEGARFIMSCGTQMGLGHNTMATGVVYFHRFYMFHSFKSFPRYVTACCCLLLAGKVEETPKKCRDIIRTARNLLTDNYFYSFGEDPKEEVMTLERILLQTIKFDLQVDHPYSFLLKYAKCIKGDQQKLQKMVQMAWNFVNDSLSTVVCLQWEPEIIAVALIYLASKLSKFTVVDWHGRLPHHTRWWDMFVAEVTMEILEDICHQVLDLYQANQKESNGPPSPPQQPPSRAELPKPAPPSQKVRLSSSSSSSLSPVRKSAKVMQSSSAISTISSLVPPLHASTSAAAAAAASAYNLPLNNTTNHIQPIRSLANSAPLPPALDAAHSSMSTMPSTSSAAAASSSYHQMPHHMYRAPPPPATNAAAVHTHQMSSMYGTAPAPPPPPPPPQHSYGGSGSSTHLPPLPPPPPAPYPPNVWPPPALPPSSHYPSNLPPMPPPHSAPTHMSQQPPPPSHGSSGYYHHQQHQHHPRHHTQHYGRQQRY